MDPKLKEFASALIRLQDIPDFKLYETFEFDTLEDYKTKASMVNVNDNNYPLKVAQVIGKAMGLREWRFYKTMAKEAYAKELNKGVPNDGRKQTSNT